MKNLKKFVLKPSQDNLNYDRAWLKYYSQNTYPNIDYPNKSMYKMIEFVGKMTPDNFALDFLGRELTYKDLLKFIDKCAIGLIKLGVKKGDKITVCLPNTPHTTIAFYAINKIGAISNMVHPLSAPKEIEHYLDLTDSKFAITIDFAFKNFEKVKDNTSLEKIVVCKVDDYLKSSKKIGYWVLSKRKIPDIPKMTNIIKWKELLKNGENLTICNDHEIKASNPAVILYTGGTTGKQKGVLLSNLNFNALALQTGSQANVDLRDRMMCIMPFFHGFGLGVTMHTCLVFGAEMLLVPKFTVEDFAKTFKKHKPEFIAGVPTLFTALTKSKKMIKSDFSHLKGIFSGADTLPNNIKVHFEEFITERGGTVSIREGYGLTETVTASCLTPSTEYRFGSIGIPFPDTLFKICKVGTQETCRADENGEICICGPTVMLRYYNDEKETNMILQKHDDDKIWVHTGDLGSMDKDGFIYFKQRIKRIIKHSGYSIFPSQIENALISHEAIANACVMGVPDTYQIEKIRAYIVLEKNYKKSHDLKADIIKRCKEYLSLWSMPQEIIFRDELPLTKVGKINYTELEKEILDELNKKNINIYEDIKNMPDKSPDLYKEQDIIL